MAVLSASELRQRIEAAGLVDPFDPAGLQGASYDLRLGDDYVLQSQTRTPDPQTRTILIKAGEFLVLSSLERLNVPNDLVGHNGLMSDWTRRGLVSLFSPQIDPGFRGILAVPVFNAGSEDIRIDRGQRIFTVEFMTLTSPAPVGWSDKHGEVQRLSAGSAPTHAITHHGRVQTLERTVGELSQEVKQLKTEHEALLKKRNFDGQDRALVLAVIAIAVSAITLIAGLFLPEVRSFFRLEPVPSGEAAAAPISPAPIDPPASR